MKKTFTVNLAGLVYNIDEDAYNKLKDYLNAIESFLSDENERKEIMNDIETRISELLNEKISNVRAVITIEDINEIIKIMGEPDDFRDEDESKKTKSTTYGYRSYRRIYRDPDNRIIGGVCSGLAAYWRIDPTIVRVIFIILCIFGGSGLLIYLILWIIIPEAKTTAQKLEMRGEPVNVSNIIDFFKEEFEKVKNSMGFNKKNN